MNLNKNRKDNIKILQDLYFSYYLYRYRIKVLFYIKYQHLKLIPKYIPTLIIENQLS